MAIYYSFFILTQRQKDRPSAENPNPHLHAEMNSKTVKQPLGYLSLIGI